MDKVSKTKNKLIIKKKIFFRKTKKKLKIKKNLENMQQEDIDIISFLGALIWSNNVIKKKVFYETYGKILETKIAEIIEFERRLEIISKECGIKVYIYCLIILIFILYIYKYMYI